MSPMVCTLPINDILTMKLAIPNYQRPYKWKEKNVRELLYDMLQALDNKKEARDSFRYRLGTILLHKIDDESLNIVDGQQRLLTLSLLKLA